MLGEMILVHAGTDASLSLTADKDSRWVSATFRVTLKAAGVIMEAMIASSALSNRRYRFAGPADGGGHSCLEAGQARRESEDCVECEKGGLRGHHEKDTLYSSTG